MDDLARKVERVAHNVEVAWDPARQRRVESRIESALTASRWPRAAGFALGGMVAMTAVVLSFWSRGSSPVAAPRASVSPAATHTTSDAQQTLRFEDGSQVQALVPETRWVMERAERQHSSVRLERGTARFAVVPNADRVFVALAGPTELRVMGASFRVAMGTEAVAIAVERGSVELRVNDRTQVLAAGDETSFALTPQEIDTPAPPSASGDETAVSAGNAGRGRASPRWDVLARDGDYERAYARLTQQGNREVSDSPGDLLLAADTARLSEHPARAVDYLERFLDRYPTDPRAALTAFTLGRVQLQELGQPAKAAKAFALVRRLAPAGDLAEDALAREVESWSRAGRAQEALSLAEEYVRTYPAGRRLHMVRRLGGL